MVDFFFQVTDYVQVPSNKCGLIIGKGGETIKNINARKNYIADVEVEVILTSQNLETVNLEENPLNKNIFEELEKSSSVSSVRIVLSARQQEEWEDLSI